MMRPFSMLASFSVAAPGLPTPTVLQFSTYTICLSAKNRLTNASPLSTPDTPSPPKKKILKPAIATLEQGIILRI